MFVCALSSSVNTPRQLDEVSGLGYVSNVGPYSIRRRLDSSVSAAVSRGTFRLLTVGIPGMGELSGTEGRQRGGT